MESEKSQPKAEISERKKLANSEELYHKMISEVKDYAIILLDANGYVLDWNKGAERLKGYKPDEIIGRHFSLFYSPEDKQKELPTKLLSEAVRNGSVIDEGYRIRKDKSRFWASVTITALHSENGEIIGYSKVTKDLTDQKIAKDQLTAFTDELKLSNEMLRRSEERYHKMIAEVQDYAILSLSKEGIIENWNAGAELLKGYTATEITGKNFKVFYPEEDVKTGLPDKLLMAAADQGRAEHEGWRIRKDGSKFWASVIITALHDKGGFVTGFSKVTRDLTERKKSEDDLKSTTLDLQDKNRTLTNLNSELSSFAYIVSHDLKEPIRKIRIFSGRQREENKTIQEINEYSIKIEHSAERMQGLMDDLIRYSELSNVTNPDVVDLNLIIANVMSDLELIISEKQALINVETLPPISGVSHQLHQLFLNLISNSLKFSKPNETLEIEVHSKTVDAGSVPFLVSSPELSFLEITFKDNGIGFEQAHAEKIFQVFQKLHRKQEVEGSGIGLAIVKKVMTNHGGIVHAIGTPGNGATFKLYFPR